MEAVVLTLKVAALFTATMAVTWAAAPIDNRKQDCEVLQTTDFSGIVHAPTQVSESKIISSEELPGYCRVKGYVAPNVGIELLLPTSNWNGKFLEVGCGGYCGKIFEANSLLGCGRGLRKGYACIASDMGHQGSGALWAYNNPSAEIDYGLRAAHVAAVAGKAITEHFYKTAPKWSYFTGCSTGGRQALVEAQRYPWDFDGIVAGAPAINLSATLLNILWVSLVDDDKAGKPQLTRADVELVHKAALAQCD
jgi:feruloyl esterase